MPANFAKHINKIREDIKLALSTCSDTDEFSFNNPIMYNLVIKNQWLTRCKNLISSDSGRAPLPTNKIRITFEMCFEDAQQYTSRSEWQNKSFTFHNRARSTSGWYSACCEHMSD